MKHPHTHNGSTYQVENGLLQNVHSAESCAGPRCPIHTWSDHHMTSWPQRWTDAHMERVCTHGLGHPDPDDVIYQETLQKERLTRNAAKCLECGETIESLHRHDFVSCGCGNLSVDGGLVYVRVLVRNGHESMSDRCEYETGESHACDGCCHPFRSS